MRLNCILPPFPRSPTKLPPEAWSAEYVFLWGLPVFHHQVNQKYQHHRCRHSRRDHHRFDAEAFVGHIDHGLLRQGVRSDTADEKPMGIDAVRSAGKQGAVVSAFDDLQIRGVGGLNDLDEIHLIGQHLIQHDNLEGIVFFHPVQIGKQLGTGQTSMGREDTVSIFATHR